MKAIVGSFNQEKALVALALLRDYENRSFYSTIRDWRQGTTHHLLIQGLHVTLHNPAPKFQIAAVVSLPPVITSNCQARAGAGHNLVSNCVGAVIN